MKPPKNIIDEAIRYIGIACVVMMAVLLDCILLPN
jgi:hypothetical protein